MELKFAEVIRSAMCHARGTNPVGTEYQQLGLSPEVLGKIVDLFVISSAPKREEFSGTVL